MLQSFRTTAQPVSYYVQEVEKAKAAEDFSYARSLLRSATEVHPDCARLWQERAKSTRSNPDWDDLTLQCFAKAYDLDPRNRHIAMEYAGFLSRKNQYAKAEEIYISMMAGEGETIRLLCALGHGYQARKKYRLALASFERAYTLDPRDGIAQRRYYEVVEIMGRECNDNDQKTLSARLIRMTGEYRLAGTPEIRPEAR